MTNNSKQNVGGMAPQQVQTTLAEAIDNTEYKTRLDESCKELLAEKAILAMILKYTVPEFGKRDPGKIAGKYISGTPEISRAAVLPGKTSTESALPRIDAAGLESVIPGEGRVALDIRVNVLLPMGKSLDARGAGKKGGSEKFGLKMTETLERKVNKMCNYSDYVERRGIAKGRAEGKAEGRVEGILIGKSEGALGKLVNQILRKRDLGQPEDKIADDLLESPETVDRVCILAAGKTPSASVVEEIVRIIAAENAAAGLA